MNRIAVTGFRGQIGRRLVALNAIPMDCNILDKDSIKREMDRIKPDVVINSAAMSNVAECEKDYEKATSVNVWGHNKLCEVVGDRRVILLSSEHVFDGFKGNYREDDDPSPINAYGLTKFAAEGVNAIYNNKTIRLSRTINNHIECDIYKYVDAVMNDESIRVPTFFFRNYIHTDFVAQGIMYFADNFSYMPELLHYGGTDAVSFFALMNEIVRKVTGSTELVIPRENEISDAVRPRDCSLDLTLARMLKVPLFSLEQSIQRLLKEKPYA